MRLQHTLLERRKKHCADRAGVERNFDGVEDDADRRQEKRRKRVKMAPSHKRTHAFEKEGRELDRKSEKQKNPWTGSKRGYGWKKRRGQPKNPKKKQKMPEKEDDRKVYLTNTCREPGRQKTESLRKVKREVVVGERHTNKRQTATQDVEPGTVTQQHPYYTTSRPKRATQVGGIEHDH